MGNKINMRIFVKAKPLSHEESIEKIDENNFVIAVKEPPIKGAANQAIIRALAICFKTRTSQIKFVSGFTSR